MKRIQLTTPTGRIATLDVEIEKFQGQPIELFLSAHVDKYDRAFSTISRQRIIDALTELWKLEYDPAKDESEPIEAANAEVAEVETEVEGEALITEKKARKASK